jgi:hypothetical protein
MVLSSISPLFVLWAVRGTPLIPNSWFVAACTSMVVIPNAFLFLRRAMARAHRDKRELVVGRAEDHRDHLLVYLFAMLLPFYGTNLNSWREFSATLVAVCFIVFLFWNLNLHYMNVVFAILGYRIFTVYLPEDGNPLNSGQNYVLITKRPALIVNQRLYPYRLSDTVLWETD